MHHERSNPPSGHTTDEPAAHPAPTLDQAVMQRPQFDPATKTIEIPAPIAGGLLTFKLGQKKFTDEQMTFLASLGIRPNWHPAYVIAFLNECWERGLNPWSGEAFLLHYPDGFVRHIGIAGWLRNAEKSRGFQGMDRVVFFDQEQRSYLRWPHRDQVPYAAEATVYRRDRRPQTVPVIYDEYVPMVEDTQTAVMPDGTKWKIPTGKGKVPTPKWRCGAEGGMATMLLAKVARVASLRLQFPRFAGWYEPAELERAAVESRPYDGGEVAEQRRAAFAAAQEPGRTVDGADVGASVRETITVTGPSAAGDARPWTEAEVRARLLAELHAQAEVLGMPVEAMTRRWSVAHRIPFEQASIRDMTAYVQRFRSYVIGRLRDTGRHRLATTYADAPTIGSVEQLFGHAEPWTVPAGGPGAAGAQAAERETVGAAA